jgi:hypothetical protein
LNKYRKAISTGLTATMLASLLATVAATSAFAALGSSGGGTIVPGGAASAAFCLTVAEDSVTDFANGTFEVAVLDNAAVDANIFWVTSSVPAVTVTAGVGGATAGFVADELVITVSGTDVTKIDSFSICNLKVDSLAAAAQGAVIFDVDGDTVGLPEGLVPAAGVTAAAITGGVTANFAVTLNAGSPAFQVTGTACDSAAALSAGNVTVAASGIVPAETFAAVATTDGTQVTKASPLTGDKPVGTAVTQQVCDTRFPSVVTVGDAVDVSAASIDTLQAGVNNQDAGNVTVLLGYFDGLLQDGDTVTFTIDTPGVLFSPNSCITACVTGTNITAASPTLGAGRTTLTVTLDETGGDDAGTEGQISAGLADSLLFNPDYDVALGTPSGTTVDVSVTVSRAGVTIIGSPVTVGVVGFVVAGSTSAPTVQIGQNDQSTGMITLTESAAGSIAFTAPNGFIKVCLQTGDEDWSVGRYFWAVVTAGDLKLNVAGLAATQGRMTIDGDCLEIQVYTVSTVASTIEIRDGSATAPAASGATNGPKVNVDNGATPGPVYVDVWSDAPNAGFAGATQVGDNIVIAVRAYSNTPIVSVSGQPTVTRGGLGQAIGNIIITEGAPNQFEDLEDFLVCPVNPSGAFTSAWSFSSPVGVNQPVVSTNSTVSGLIALFDPTPDVAGCLDIEVDDAGLAGLGVITLSNLKVDVLADAPLGNLFVRVFDNDLAAPQLLNQIVSPAKIGTGVAGTATTRLGVTQIGAFTTSTKVAKTGKYVTYRFDFGAGAAGAPVQIWGATKTGNDWSAFSVVTTRTANASGVVYYYIRQNSATWKSYRALNSGAWTPARQARWIP